MKLQTSGYVLGQSAESIALALSKILPRIAVQVNNASEGRISGAYNAVTQPPSAGLYAQGDYIRNSEPQELGSSGSKYVIKGWVCVAGGEPGTWVEDRGLTGA